MKVNYRTIVECIDTFQNVAKLELPIFLSWKFKKLLDEVVIRVNEFESFRRDLIQKYGVPEEENPNIVSVKSESENFQTFNEQREEFLNEEIELEYEPIQIQQILKHEDIKITPIDLKRLTDTRFIVE